MPNCCAGSPTPPTTRRFGGPDCCGSSCSDEVPADEARAYVAAFAEHAETDLTRYEHQRDSAPSSDDPADAPADFFGRAALEYGLRNAVMEADWANWLIDEMDHRPI